MVYLIQQTCQYTSLALIKNIKIEIKLFNKKNKEFIKIILITKNLFMIKNIPLMIQKAHIQFMMKQIFQIIIIFKIEPNRLIIELT